LVVKRQHQVLRRWMRHDENLSLIEEKLVSICELEVGRNLNDEEERSVEDIIDF
jgi:hypothetical protein